MTMFRSYLPRAILFALCFLLLSQWSEAALSIKPAYVEMNIERGRPSRTITVSNVTDEQVTYRLHAVHFVYTPDGNFKMIPPDEHSLVSWVKTNPREFTLAPKASRLIRFTVIPPGNLKPGEYWGAVWFEPLTGRTTRAESAEGSAMTIKLSTNILVPVVGLVQKITYDCRLADLSASKKDTVITISARLTNAGTGRVNLKGAYEILNAASAVVAQGLIGDDTILAGGERIFSQRVNGDFAETGYAVRVKYTSQKLATALAGETSIHQQQ